MRRSTEGQIQAQLAYLQAQINELASGQTEIHRRIDSLRQEFFRVKHALHLHELKEAKLRSQNLRLVEAAVNNAAEARAKEAHVLELDTLDE